MPPRSATPNQQQDSLLERAICELEHLKASDKELHPFPQCCQRVVLNMPGNSHCIDCGAHSPDWCTISYGALICMTCCAKHRSLGVQYSKVRSMTLDHWSHSQILNMLEGGNGQLERFFERHHLLSGKNASANLGARYRTKAARFYRRGMQDHVATLSSSGMYQGRQRPARSDDVSQPSARQLTTEAVQA